MSPGSDAETGSSAEASLAFAEAGPEGDVPSATADTDEMDGAGGMDAGFAWDFAARAKVALLSTPAWTCATTLPTVPAADSTAARAVIQAFVAQVVGVAVADVTVDEAPCNTPATISCSGRFAHDCAKSGGDTYNIVLPLAQELEAHADSVEETIWVPTNMTGNVVLSGIADGWLVGMVLFNGQLPCR